MHTELDGFNLAEQAMIGQALESLRSAGYDTVSFQVLIRANLPVGYRGMTWPDGVVLGDAAFASQAMLNHVLEEELRHLVQKAQSRAKEFGPGTARFLEEEVDAERKFPLPEE